MQLKHHEATPLLCLIMGSVVRPFTYFWPRLILSIYPLQLTLTADQQEKIHTAFYVPGLPRKTMWCTHIIQTHSQRHSFLVNLLHQGAGSIQIERGHLSNYGDECPVCNALYMQKERETVCEREKNRQRKARHTVLLKTQTFVSEFQESLHVPAGEIKLRENCKAPVKAQKGNSFHS